MTKSELILKITSKNSYLYHKDVFKIIDTLFNCVTKALKDGDRVELRGFGVFSTKTQKARISRNPQTNKKINTPEKKTIHFKMSKDLFKILNNEKK